MIEIFVSYFPFTLQNVNKNNAINQTWYLVNCADSNGHAHVSSNGDERDAQIVS